MLNSAISVYQFILATEFKSTISSLQAEDRSWTSSVPYIKHAYVIIQDATFHGIETNFSINQRPALVHVSLF